jgi:signal transduction histidine kinase
MILISLAAAQRCGMFLTSSATTAKPVPRAPARAASTAALSARILVWYATPLCALGNHRGRFMMLTLRDQSTGGGRGLSLPQKTLVFKLVIQRVRTMLRTSDLNRTAVDLNGLVAEALGLMRTELQKHRILVKTELAVQLPRVIGDQIQLQQMLLNLIANAIDSMAALDERRLLCVNSDVHDDGGVTISVTDIRTGVGPRDTRRIFDPLFTPKSEGMGMGLAICLSIIEAHSGRMLVAPNKPHAAVFQLVLRTDDATSADTPRSAQTDDLMSNSRL